MDQKPPQWVVCAALRKGEVIICGARHFDSIMRSTIRVLSNDYRGYEQGFIDQTGKFLTRVEAWKVAEANGQIRRRCGNDTSDGGTLFSENLY
jgi:hypothetical protein